MKKASKMLAVLTAVAMLATGPGIEAFAAGQNAGHNAQSGGAPRMSPGGSMNANPNMSHPAGMPAASPASVPGNANVNQGIPNLGASAIPNAAQQGSDPARAASMARSESPDAKPVEIKAGEVTPPSAEGSLPNNEALRAAARMSPAGAESTDQPDRAYEQGKTNFDGAKAEEPIEILGDFIVTLLPAEAIAYIKEHKPAEVRVVSMSGEWDIADVDEALIEKIGSGVYQGARNEKNEFWLVEQRQAAAPAPKPSLSVTWDGVDAPSGRPSKLSTLVDAVAIGAAATGAGLALHSGWAGFSAGYLALIGISNLRYTQVLGAVLNDKKINNGVLRGLLLTLLSGAFLPAVLVAEVYDNLVAPLIKDIVQAVKDLYNAAVRLAREFVTWLGKVWDNLVQALKDFVTWMGKVFDKLVQAVKDLYNAAVRLVKRFANWVAEVFKDVVKAVKDAAIWVKDNILVPLWNVARGLGAGAVAGIAAAVIVIVPFLASMGISFIAKPLHQLWTTVSKWPVAFSIPAALVILAGLGLAAASLPVISGLLVLIGLTFGGSAIVGLFGGAWEGLVEGYRNGFVSGIRKGVGDAWKLATGSYGKAKTNYSAWRTNLK